MTIEAALMSSSTIVAALNARSSVGRSGAALQFLVRCRRVLFVRWWGPARPNQTPAPESPSDANRSGLTGTAPGTHRILTDSRHLTACLT
jgi:hypothetical protein